MNRLDESRRRTKEKARRKTVITALVIIVVLLVFSLAARAVFNRSSREESRADQPVNSQQGSPGQAKDDDQEDTDPKEDPVQREALEAQRKEEYGAFYVPLPASQGQPYQQAKVKGLYLNHNNVHLDFDEGKIKAYEDYVKYKLGQADSYPDGAENANVLEQMLAICNTTEINAIVIDIKTDDGYLTWESDIDIVNELDTDALDGSFNYEKLLSYMKERDIIPIARIVTFKDTILAARAPDHAMKTEHDQDFVDSAGAGWVNPHDRFVWDYVLAICKETALRGFEEIQFDYIRYPEATSEHIQVDQDGNTDDRDSNIQKFLDYAYEELEDYNIGVGAAVFGIITSTWEDEPENIGQTWLKITGEIDHISPMLYPSHYSSGWYGFESPDHEPYGMVYAALADAYEKNSAVEGSAAIRPWIQGFTASYMDDYADYDGKMVAEQVRAALDLGLEEYIIWDASNEYDPEIFKYSQSYQKAGPIKFEDFPPYSMEDVLAEQNEGIYKVEDRLARSPYDVLASFFSNLKADNPGRTFLLSKRSSREDSFQGFLENSSLIGLDYDSFETRDVAQDGQSFLFDVIFYQGELMTPAQVRVELEDELFKVSDIEMGQSQTNPNGPVNSIEDEGDPGEGEVSEEDEGLGQEESSHQDQEPGPAEEDLGEQDLPSQAIDLDQAGN